MPGAPDASAGLPNVRPASSSNEIVPGRARPRNTWDGEKISASPEYFRTWALLTNGRISTENLQFVTPRILPVSYGSGFQSEFPAKTWRPRARDTCRTCGHRVARVQALHAHLHAMSTVTPVTFGQPRVLMIRYAPRRTGRGGRRDARRSEDAAMLTAGECLVPSAVDGIDSSTRQLAFRIPRMDRLTNRLIDARTASHDAD